MRFSDAALFIASLWIFYFVSGLLEAVGAVDLLEWGILPRTATGLPGILIGPLLHYNAWHLLANTLPLAVLLSLAVVLCPNRAVPAIVIIWLVGGVGTWIIGRYSLHLGASGLIFGLVTYLIASAIWLRNLRAVLIALIVTVLYAPMLWGIFPSEPRISWEAHLCGAVAGIMAAWILTTSSAETIGRRPPESTVTEKTRKVAKTKKTRQRKPATTSRKHSTPRANSTMKRDVVKRRAKKSSPGTRARQS